MASSSKRPKLAAGLPSAEEGFIRICDDFRRTVGKVICPIMRANESVRVLFKLQREELEALVRASEGIAGMRLDPMEWHPMSPNQPTEGNIFIPYSATEAVDEEKFEKFRVRVSIQLEQRHNVKNTLIEKLETKSAIPQPIIAERDFDLYKLKLTGETLRKGAGDSTELRNASKILESELEDLEEGRITIGVLSQNGRGKSFFLNLLFFLTADTEEEYQKNNRDMKLPKNTDGNLTIEKLKDEDIQMFPKVIQNVLTKIRDKDNEDKKKNVNTFAESLVHMLDVASEEEIQKSVNSLSEWKNYFSARGRPLNEPYILAQKDVDRSYESTTKCLIHLSYSPLYQMKVEYFKAEDLKDQLFELKPLMEEGTSEKKDEDEAALKVLKARLALLTDLISDEKDEKNYENVTQKWNSSEDIILSSDAMEYAGTTGLYIGNGKNATSDRLALKALLKQLTTSQEKDDVRKQHYRKRIAAVKKIDVYIPSKILIGREILEMPGTDESDPMAIYHISNGLKKVDVIWLISENSLTIGEKGVKDTLRDSMFFQPMLENPKNYKLMLLSYPEMQSSWQFGEGDEEKLKPLQQTGEKKRKGEMETLTAMVKDKGLTFKLEEDSIYTSYILPVLHTSIHSLEGKPHEIIKKHSTFLEDTGITKLFIALDKFAAAKQKASVMQINNDLNKLLEEADGGFTVENSTKCLSQLENKELRVTREANLRKHNEDLLIDLNKKLYNTMKGFVDVKFSDLLAGSISKAHKRWDDNESRIDTIRYCNPYYSGKHRSYEVNIYDLLFEGLVDEAKPHFKILIKDLEKELHKYQEEAIKLLVDELDCLLQNGCESIKGFVEMAVKQSLVDAQSWYMGKIRLPINEQNLQKHLEKSLKMSLKINMLQPAYKTDNISNAKKIMKSSIQKTLKGVAINILELMSELHLKRFKSFSGKIKDGKGDSRMWQLLLGKIKAISKDSPLQDGVKRKAVKMLSQGI